MGTNPSQPAAAPSPPTIHEAARESGASGAVLRRTEIEPAAAAARRRAGLDVVVCGAGVEANRRLAIQIESAVGPATRPQATHKNAGPMALPHLHQLNRSPDGHTFYETDRRKTKRMP